MKSFPFSPFPIYPILGETGAKFFFRISTVIGGLKMPPEKLLIFCLTTTHLAFPLLFN
jgi:hypothetical protein